MRPAPSCAAPASLARHQRHRPEETTLYRVVQAHLDTYLAFVDIETCGAGLPSFVTDEFDAFLACGILAHGFLRLRCDGCREEKLVAFSCKRRGICPSCGTRRMAEAAAHLVDHVIPTVPVRQWVLSFPIPLRSLFAVHPELLAPILQIIHRAIATFLFQQTGQKRDQAATGAVTLIQRFGSAANLNIHLHALVLDGVYGNLDALDTAGTLDESMPAPAALTPAPIFHPAGAPTHAALQALLGKIITRILRLLTRLGHLAEEDGQTYLAGGVTDPDDVMTPLKPPLPTIASHRARVRGRGYCICNWHRAVRGEAMNPQHSAPTRTASACTQACALRPMTGAGWSNCAATSPVRRLPTSA